MAIVNDFVIGPENIVSIKGTSHNVVIVNLQTKITKLGINWER